MTASRGGGNLDNRFMKYLEALKAPTIHPVYRLCFLNPDNSVAFEVGSEFISGDLSVNQNDGVRRTATITLTNVDKLYSIGLDNIWVGQKVRLEAGLKLDDSSDYLLPMGVFYIKDPTEDYQPSANSLTLNLIDKFAWLDGTLNGNLSGIHQINPNDDLRVAARELLLRDIGNGEPIDNVPPVFDSYYNDKTATLADGTIVPFTNAPYTYRTAANGTAADVILAVNTMLVASCGYDTYGHLRFQSAQTDIVDYNRPIAWEFSVLEREFMGASYTHQMSSIYNDVKVIGAVVDGTQIQGRATNKNPRSDTSVDKIGYRTYVISDEKYHSFTLANEAAKYELRKRTMLQKAVSFTASPIYHINEGDLITLVRPEISTTPEKYIVVGYSLPLGTGGAMTINAVSVSDIDIYDKWLPSYGLSVFYSQIGVLKLTYDDTEVDLSNPYTVSEIPAGAQVSFETTGTPAYTISSVILNGTPLPHTGTSCSFTMPDFDSRIVFSFTPTSGSDVSFTYTGEYEEITDGSLGYKIMNGSKYKLIKFTSSGTLTFDSTQLSAGIVGDIHCRGGGGSANATTAGSNGYDSFEKDVQLQDVEVVVGTGGEYSDTKGKRGLASSFGTLVQAPGGGQAVGDSSGQGGTLSKIFGSDYSDTTTGKGGAVGNAGSSGAVWMRIAI